MTAAPNIVWMTLDSVRADHTTMDGYSRETTPEIQRIADQSDGQWFSNCFAHSNSTRISVASLITGTYPSHHGVRGNRTIPTELNTIPELLSEAGYHTVGLSRNANSSMGFNRGFDEFEWIAAETLLDAVDVRTVLKYALNIRRHSAGLTTKTAKHATPFIINDMAKRRLRSYSGSEEPFFMYLHYNEPHRPYFPPLPYLDKYTDEIAMSTEEAAEFAMEMHWNCDELIAGGVDLTDDRWDALQAMYDAEIAYTDECVGRLFDYIQSLDLEDTIVVITADHGEMFGEQGMLAHKVVLHDDLIRVPMVTHGLDDVAGGHKLVQHSDFMQTLASLAGAATDQIQGIDLHSESREYALSQDWNDGEYFDVLEDINPDFDRSRYHGGLLTCLRDRKFKYLDSEDQKELFELPDEETEVSGKYPDRAEEMAHQLREWFETDGQPISTDATEEEFSDAMKEQLSDLGYLVD